MTAKKRDASFPPLPSVSDLSNLARSDFDQWLKLLVTGGAQLPFGSSAGYATHPLRGYFDKHTSIINSERLIYTELMELHAEKLGFVEVVSQVPDIVTVRERIVQLMLVDISAQQVEGWRTSVSLVEYMWLFIRDAISNLSLALSDTAHDVAAGAPLYRLNSAAGIVARHSIRKGADHRHRIQADDRIARGARTLLRQRVLPGRSADLAQAKGCCRVAKRDSLIK